MEDYVKFALQQSLGQLLRSVEGLLFVPSGESIQSLDNLDQLRITLGTNSIRFRCSGEGEALTIDEGELCPSDLGEYGELRRTDLSQEPKFGILANTPLRRTFLLKSHGDKFTIGCVLEFAGSSLVICNWGDELKVWDSVPEPLFAGEGIRIVPS